jgi:vacuolar-type H+-ATPase subunit I/STV1
MATPQEKLEALFKNTELADLEFGGETADEVIEGLEERINEEEIIYYSNAIEYLKENDASLKESLGLASEIGFTLENLSSETLATLLYQQNLRNELSNLRKEIEAIFEE